MLSNIYMYRIYSSKLCKFSQIDLLKMYATFWGGVEVALCFFLGQSGLRVVVQ